MIANDASHLSLNLQPASMPLLQEQPMPDLCLLAIFGLMPLNDRLKAHGVCPRWGRLVREASRLDVRSLTITLSDGLNGGEVGELSIREIKEHIDSNCTSSLKKMTSPFCMLILMNNYFPHPLTKWNCLQITDLQQWNTVTLKTILSIFSSITELIFLNQCHKSSNKKVYKYLLQLLKMLQSEAQPSLTAFKLIVRQNRYSRSEALLCHLLFLHITKIKHLTILNDEQRWSTDVNSRNRTRWLDRATKLCSSAASNFYINRTCLSLVLTTAIRLTLQVDWLKQEQLKNLIGNIFFTPHRVTLMAQFSGERFFHFRYTNYQPITEIPSILLNLGRSVHSIWLNILPSSCQKLFLLIGINALPFLTEFGLEIDFSLCALEELEHLQPIPIHPIDAVRYLKLQLTIKAHRQILWFNLPLIFPRLISIHLVSLECTRCGVKTTRFADSEYLTPTKRIQAINCLRRVLLYLHETGVPLDKILFEGQTYLGSPEQLLLQQ